MAGRRLRDAVKSVLTSGGRGANIHVVIAGLTNTYSQYVTTFEEYEVQRYEVSFYFFNLSLPNTFQHVVIERKISQKIGL